MKEFRDAEDKIDNETFKDWDKMEEKFTNFVN